MKLLVWCSIAGIFLVNTACNYVKPDVLETADPEIPEEDRTTPEEDMVNRADVDHLRMALEGISPDNRELIVLNRFTGLPYDRIAEIIDCGIGALKVRMHRAIKELKDQFHKVSGE